MESANIIHIGYVVEQLLEQFDSPTEVLTKFADRATMQMNDSLIFLLSQRLWDAAADSSLDSEAFQSLRIALIGAKSMLEMMNRLGNEYNEMQTQAMRGRPKIVETPIDQL